MKEEVKVVIAEDNEGHTSLIRKNLKRAGIKNEIIEFQDGVETMNYFNENIEDSSHSPHLLILDLKMPKKNGFEVLEELKQDNIQKDIPVIVLTTTDDPREIKKCHRLGCSNYITKPIDYEEFVDTITKLGFFLKIVDIA